LKLFAVSSLLLAGLASAHQPDVKECAYMASDFYVTATERDMGKTKAAQYQELADGLAACRVNPKCLYKDDEDEAMVRHGIDYIYSDQGKTHDPDAIAIMFFNMCKKTALKGHNPAQGVDPELPKPQNVY
jgi:hypothetical protein